MLFLYDFIADYFTSHGKFIYGTLLILRRIYKYALYLKVFLTYGFLLLYLLAMIRPVAPLFEYVVNHDYIAEFLCVNKDKVWMHCDGKCYLMKRLKQQNDDKRQNLPKISMDDYPIGFITFISLAIPHKAFFYNKKNTLYKNSYRYLYSHLTFHPPSSFV